MNALVPAAAHVPALSWGEMERLGSYIAKSRLFGIQTTEQALVLMAISQAEGRHPALAARDYDIIQGKPAKKAEAMMRDFMSAGGKIEWHALDDTQADATFSHPQGGKVRIAWTLERAKTAGLAGKDMWKKFPRQMLRSRTVSEGVRTVFPMATSGMYVPEEIGDFGDAPRPERRSAPTIDAEVRSQPSAAETLNDSIPALDAEAAAPRPTLRDILRRDLSAATSAADVLAVADRPAVQRALASAPEPVREEIKEMLAEAYGRFQQSGEGAADDADLPAFEDASA